MGRAVGIDLGTTNSCIATLEDVYKRQTHTYSVYQIFTGTYGSDGSLGNVAAGQNFKTCLLYTS